MEWPGSKLGPSLYESYPSLTALTTSALNRVRGVLGENGQRKRDGGMVPRYLRAESGTARSAVDTEPLWWLPAKIVGRYLAPFLATRLGLSEEPPQRPSSAFVPVELELDPDDPSRLVARLKQRAPNPYLRVFIRERPSRRSRDRLSSEVVRRPGNRTERKCKRPRVEPAPTSVRTVGCRALSSEPRRPQLI